MKQIKKNKLCIILTLGALASYIPCSAFADNNYNIAFETINSNFDKSNSSIDEKFIFTQNVFKNNGFTYFYKINLEVKPNHLYSVEPDLGVKTSVNMYINPSLQVGFDHGFASSSADATAYTKFIYKLGNSVKITPRLAANIELDNLGLKYDGQSYAAFKIGPSYKVTDQLSVGAEYKQSMLNAPDSKAIELKIGYDF